MYLHQLVQEIDPPQNQGPLTTGLIEAVGPFQRDKDQLQDHFRTILILLKSGTR